MVVIFFQLFLTSFFFTLSILIFLFSVFSFSLSVCLFSLSASLSSSSFSSFSFSSCSPSSSSFIFIYLSYLLSLSMHHYLHFLYLSHLVSCINLSLLQSLIHSTPSCHIFSFLFLLCHLVIPSIRHPCPVHLYLSPSILLIHLHPSSSFSITLHLFHPPCTPLPDRGWMMGARLVHLSGPSSVPHASGTTARR